MSLFPGWKVPGIVQYFGCLISGFLQDLLTIITLAQGCQIYGHRKGVPCPQGIHHLYLPGRVIIQTLRTEGQYSFLTHCNNYLFWP